MAIAKEQFLTIHLRNYIFVKKKIAKKYLRLKILLKSIKILMLVLNLIYGNSFLYLIEIVT